MPDAEWRPRLPAIRETMGRFVAEREAELRPAPLPFVRQTLEHLRDRGATLGVATGDLRAIGQIKLRRAGLLDFLTVGGWSDEYEHRTDVFRNAVRLTRLATHPEATICVLADTPVDITSAHANDLPIIAVATGIYSREQLVELQPELCLTSLEELFSKSVDQDRRRCLRTPQRGGRRCALRGCARGRCS